MASGARSALTEGESLRHFPEYSKLSEVREGGFFLRKNPICRMVPVYTFPKNALRFEGKLGGEIALGFWLRGEFVDEAFEDESLVGRGAA